MPTDSGYLVFLADAPDDPDELTDEEIQERMHTVCLHCLIDQHPEAGPGLDLARKHGTVERDPDTGRWHR